MQNHTSKPKVLDIGCGNNALYQYFSQALTGGFNYTGIDISENAVKKASHHFPGVNFNVVNNDFAPVNGKFNAVIFNEVLYYFVKPMKTLEKAFAENVTADGCIIISMYKDPKDKNKLIWEAIIERFQF